MTTQISAAVQREVGAAPVLETLTIDDPRPGEILVAIKAVGVCHTDMVMRDGHLPIPQPVVLGHEGSGMIAKLGDGVEGFSVGDHVVLSFDSCGHCVPCEQHDPAYCNSWFGLNFGGRRASDGTTALTDADGKNVHSHIFGQSSFATYALVGARNAVKVDKDLPLELLGPLGCGIQTGAGTVLNVLKVRPGSSVAVLGTGAVGLSAIMAAKIAGAATIVALDLNMERVALARELGATHGLKADTATVLDHAAAAGVPGGFEYIIDTTGIPAVCNGAVMALAQRGEFALVGAYPAVNIEAPGNFLMSGGRVVRGVVEGGADPQAFIPQLIEHYRAGRFPFDRLVQYFDFADIAHAIEQGESGKVIKPIVRTPA
ncbi:aryl-alcohol dehydrogenase [Sphingobium sp. B1D7B]|uniref:NAD(P)-dependent alcohol dehydrogenase n=1 Tax=Sphingobium sp. B1D7B TaxID=2940578 RepID=UPI00222472DF|nr:NAD(P)-dependent alcohol dehydrogenase [Sphingobium sp. B1D7B]MCW2406917.1 aryl-alcohol dehydrogenase [Sphingobium sp. B1D7B]